MQKWTVTYQVGMLAGGYTVMADTQKEALNMVVPKIKRFLKGNCLVEVTINTSSGEKFIKNSEIS